MYRRPHVMLSTVILLSLITRSPCHAAEKASTPLVLKKTLAETMVATRSRLLTDEGGNGITWGTWYATEPKPVETDSRGRTVFPTQVDLTAKDENGKPLWQARPQWRNGEILKLPGSRRLTTYLYRTITTNAVVTISVNLRFDASFELRLNGRRIRTRGRRATLKLNEGENHLIVNAINRGRGSSFSFTPQQGTAAGLWKEVQRHFRNEWKYLGQIGRREINAWLSSEAHVEMEKEAITQALKELGPLAIKLRRDFEMIVNDNPSPRDPAWLNLCIRAGRLGEEVRNLRTTMKALGARDESLKIAHDALIAQGIDLEDRRWRRLYAQGKKGNKLLKEGRARLQAIQTEVNRVGRCAVDLKEECQKLVKANTPVSDPKWIALKKKTHRLSALLDTLDRINFKALRLAIAHLARTYPKEYTRAAEYLKRADELEKKLANRPNLPSRSGEAIAAITPFVSEIERLQADALLSNPLLDFDKLLLVRRSESSPRLGLPQNWQGNCALSRSGYDNDIAILSPVHPSGSITTLYRPESSEFVGDVDLHFSGERMLFSMNDQQGRWQIYEIGADGKGLKQVTPGTYDDVDNYDACYLPDGRIVFASTRCFHGVPCVGGNNTVANLCLLDRKTARIRQLCFDQDHNWCPTVLHNGQVMYSRWEYSDSPHYFTRLLFRMNPDGTGQMEHYGSNSFWPNSIFYARPIPGNPSAVVAVISGHHGVPRMGELIIFDPDRAHHEASGVVRRIPGYQQPVEPVIRDGLVNSSWPKFLHPYPLSDTYFLVACKPTNYALWGIYLVDIFDNMVLLAEQPGYAYLEPIPLRNTVTPPVIPDRVQLDKDMATVYLSDVYRGKGLQGVPRGTVKKLRVYELHYAYPKMGGHINIGIDGPWDARRILGTVPVEKDGSATFKVPANTPLAVQPLDDEGKALQVMRSWFTAMPGEKLSCVGCHEPASTVPSNLRAMAMARPPSEITPWYGPARGFSFPREVQPVLDKYCAGCHNGKSRDDGLTIPNFADANPGQRNFTKSYIALHPYVRRPGPESDYHLQKPGEWHADTSELIQMLQKGHKGVQLSTEAWDRLITWIDLNVPDHGTWGEHRAIASNFLERRLHMRKTYANRPENPEAIWKQERPPIEPVKPARQVKRKPQRVTAADWPFDAAEAARRQTAVDKPATVKISLDKKVSMDFTLIPAGEFVMGDASGDDDECTLSRVTIDEPFYMGVVEVTNEQYALFDPSHDSAVISQTNKDCNTPGHPVNGPRQPVIRVTWKQAMAFCDWLSKRTGRPFTLPTEAQWEWACRAGTATAFSFGDLSDNFAPYANLADQTLAQLARKNSPKWHPRDDRFADKAMVTVNVGSYAANAWGLKDMHGNVAEWTRSVYLPYQYRDDGRNERRSAGKRVVRGGSWYDRPTRARSGFRLAYQPWMPIYNVGFRVVCPARSDGKRAVVQVGNPSR